MKITISVDCSNTSDAIKLIEYLRSFDTTAAPPPKPSTPPPEAEQFNYHKATAAELKQQGWRILGPFWTDYHEKSKYIRIQPATGQRYRRFQIGKDITQKEVDALLSNTEVERWRLLMGDINITTRHLKTDNNVIMNRTDNKVIMEKPAVAEKITPAPPADACPRKPVKCGQCDKEIGTIPCNRHERSIKASLTSQHTVQTGHDSFIVGLPR